MPLFIGFLDNTQGIDPNVHIAKKPRDGYCLCKGLVEVRASQRKTSLEFVAVAFLERNEVFVTPTVTESNVLQVTRQGCSVDDPSGWNTIVQRDTYKSLGFAILVDEASRGTLIVMVNAILEPFTLDALCCIVSETACRNRGFYRG